MISLTKKAVEKVQSFAENEGDLDHKGLRIYVQGGGCAGFEYGFLFDDVKEGDSIIESGKVKVLIDLFSAPYLKESLIDYVESFQGSGFVVKNPNAKSTCGCGQSFTV